MRHYHQYSPNFEEQTFSGFADGPSLVNIVLCEKIVAVSKHNIIWQKTSNILVTSS